MIVAVPFSKERPLAKDISKSLISNDLLSIFFLVKKLSKNCSKINLSILPDSPIFPHSSYFF